MSAERITAIHQFSPSCALGDGVTSSLLFTRELLRELGFVSEIYAQHIPDALRREVRPLSAYRGEAPTLLFFHHSLGYDNDAWLARSAARKVLVYHNITPPEYLSDPNLKRLSALGREQLSRWRKLFSGAFGDSPLNTAELRKYGYGDARTLPLLVDLDRMRRAEWNHGVPGRYADSFNIVFIGRICENKRQSRLVEAVAEMRHLCELPVRLLLAGGITDSDYLETVRKRIDALHLTAQVKYLGKVDELTLRGLYRAADIFACMSEHEGFGMPLIEAMAHDIPVVAFAAASVPDTAGEGGILLDSDDPATWAATFATLATEPGLRRRVLAAQRRNLERFERPVLIAALADFLAGLGIEPPAPAPFRPAPTQRWRIEGPFDSNYSLAIVNRETARALARTGQATTLLGMDGGAAIPPSPVFLAANPDIAAMVEAPDAGLRPPEVTLRFCYPPRTDDMTGRVRAMHAYGWEETAFPADYASGFNQHLDLVTVLSREVGKILRDNGVRLPMAVVGAGIDHLRELRPEPPSVALGEGFRFLHVSSCFPRKGIDVLLAAWGRAFRAGDAVTLVIKTFPNPHNDAARQLAAMRAGDAGYPRVTLIETDQTDAAIAGLYAACHAFVAPSRGEGFGMPLAEAMWFGLPVITTAWGGQTDFCTGGTAWLCDYRFAPSSSHFGLEHSAWAEPDVDDLARQLRAVYEAAPEQRSARTAAARALIASEYTWDRVAGRTRAAVEAVERMPLLRREPRIGWVSTWGIRCGIARYSAHVTALLPKDRLVVLASHADDLLAPDDDRVRRCWHANIHVPVDELIAAIDASGIETLVIQYNFGFFSLESLARLIRHMADNGRQAMVFFHSTADVQLDGKPISLGHIAPDLARAQRIFVHGIDDLNRLKGLGLTHNVALFPQGVPPQPKLDSAALRLGRGLDGCRIIAAYGFLLPHKGMLPLIRAFAELAGKRSDLRMLLITALYPNPQSDAENADCEKLVRELGIEGRVMRMTDFLPDEESLSWLALADLIVFPYQRTQESSSAAVRMGLAAGRPVAVTPLAIFDDLGDAVHRLPGMDVPALVEGIGRLIDDPTLLNGTAARAARWSAARQWPLLSARLRDCIDGLANPLPDAGPL